MSTSYVTCEPMALEEFYRLARTAGWAVCPDPAGTSVCMTNRRYYVVDVEEAGGHVWFERFGGNEPQSLLDAVPCWSEHDDEFWVIMGDDDAETEH